MQVLRAYCPPYFTNGACGGTLFGSYGRLSIAWTGLPAGSMIRGVTKMSRFFFCVLLDSLRNSRPMKGRSPNIGTLSFVLVTFSESKPPSTTVCPSQTMQLDTTSRCRKMGNGNCDVTGVPTVLPLTRTIVGTNCA